LYLDKEIQQELNLISTSYTKIVAEFIKFVQENNLEKPHTYSVEGEEERIVYKYDSEN
jgi:mRNA-degrading endonuclease RelE of RelBE toxin-antitoxin system